MILQLDIQGIIFETVVDNDLTLNKAKEKYENDLIKVIDLYKHNPDIADYDNDDASFRLNEEGSGYAVQHYCSGDSFKNEKTAAIWNTAGNILNALDNHLEQ